MCLRACERSGAPRNSRSPLRRMSAHSLCRSTLCQGAPLKTAPRSSSISCRSGEIAPRSAQNFKVLPKLHLATLAGTRAGVAGGGVEGSHVTRFIQSGCLDAPIETHSILREPPTCKPLEAVKMGADWSGVKSPLRPLNLKPLCAPTRSNLFLPLRSTTRSTLRSAHMLWSTL